MWLDCQTNFVVAALLEYAIVHQLNSRDKQEQLRRKRQLNESKIEAKDEMKSDDDEINEVMNF